MRRVGEDIDHYGVELIKAPGFKRKRNSSTAAGPEETPHNPPAKGLADSNASQHHKRMSLA